MKLPFENTSTISLNTTVLIMHSKYTRVKLEPERVHWGQTPFRVNDDPEISQPDAKYDTELGQSDPIICQIYGKLTDLDRSSLTRNGVWPQWILSGSSLTRVFLEKYLTCTPISTWHRNTDRDQSTVRESKIPT